MKRILWNWGPVLVWMAVIFLGSSRSDLPKLNEPLFQTVVAKAVHVSEYALLAILALRALSQARENRLPLPRTFLFALLIALAYGVSDEFHQSFTPTRTPSPVDIAIDTFGASLGLIVAWGYLKVRKLM